MSENLIGKFNYNDLYYFWNQHHFFFAYTKQTSSSHVPYSAHPSVHSVHCAHCAHYYSVKIGYTVTVLGLVTQIQCQDWLDCFYSVRIGCCEYGHNAIFCRRIDFIFWCYVYYIIFSKISFYLQNLCYFFTGGP